MFCICRTEHAVRGLWQKRDRKIMKTCSVRELSCALMVQEDVAYTVRLSMIWPDLVPGVHCTSLPGGTMGPLHLTHRPLFPCRETHRERLGSVFIVLREGPLSGHRDHRETSSKMPMQPLGWRNKGVEQALKHLQSRDMIDYCPKTLKWPAINFYNTVTKRASWGTNGMLNVPMTDKERVSAGRRNVTIVSIWETARIMSEVFWQW